MDGGSDACRTHLQHAAKVKRVLFLRRYERAAQPIEIDGGVVSHKGVRLKCVRMDSMHFDRARELNVGELGGDGECGVSNGFQLDRGAHIDGE